jgi:cold shock CspA family protein
MEKDEKKQGVVVWYDPARGIGFLRIRDNGSLTDYFVHWSNIKTERQRAILFRGDQVLFDIQPGIDGKQAQAVNVEVITR